MPSPFGQSSDYSSVFASLGREQINEIASATRSAANQAADDQNAADQDTQSKWKAGQISDEEWLNYIRQRLAAAGGDPEEQQRWADALRVNEAAVEDSQFETKFQLGKITAQALLSHYRQRMGSVEENSPAYRDLASRYQQVTDYIKGGGGSSGGGGGGGGGSSAGMVAASRKGNTPGGSISASGYDQSGPDLVTPSSVFFGVGNIKYYIKTLMADQDRIKSMADQYKRDPTLRSVLDPLSGTAVPVTPEFLHGLDNQFLRNQDNLASAYGAQGDPQKVTAALTAKTDYVSTYMVDHNTDRIETVYSEFQRGQVALLKSASDLPPDQAAAVFRQVDKNTQSFINGSFPGEAGIGLRQFLGTNVTNKATQELGVAGQAITAELPPELKSSGALWNVLQGWDYLGKIGANPNLSDEERQFLGDEAIRLIPGQIEPTTGVATRGERNRLSETDVRDLVYGNPLDEANTASAQSIVGAAHRGIFATLVQRDGLNNDDPSFDGDRFVYQVNPDGSHQVVAADTSPDATGTKLILAPKGEDRSAQIQVALKIGGVAVVAYAKPTNIPINLLPAGMAVYASDGTIRVPDGKGGTKTLAAGALVPSSVIKTQESAHPGWFQGLVRSGALVKTSPAWGVVIDQPGSSRPVIWYQDDGGVLTLNPPHLETSQTDTVTKGALVDANGVPSFNAAPFAGGSVIAFGAGFTSKEMRNLVRGQVESGLLDLNDYKFRNEGGSVGESPTLDDALTPFKPTLRELPLFGAVQQQMEDWKQSHADDSLQAGLEEQRRSRSTAWLGQHFPDGGTPAPVAVDAISSIAGFLGIKIRSDDALLSDPNGAPQQTKQQDLTSVARDNALEAMLARQAQQSRGKPPLQPIASPVKYAPLPVRPQDDGSSNSSIPLKFPTPGSSKQQVVETGRYKGKKLGGV